MPAIGRRDEKVQELRRALELQLNQVGGTGESAAPQDVANGLVSCCLLLDKHDRLETARRRTVELPDSLLRSQGVASA